MRRIIPKFVFGLAVIVGAIGAVFVLGMRAKSPVVLDTVRRGGRATKRFVLPTAGEPGAQISVVRHVGRSSGQEYETPVQVVAVDDGFAIALPYGPNTDWLKNVVAAGSATLVHDGAVRPIDRPEIVSIDAVNHHFPATDQRLHRWFRVEQCLIVHPVPDSPPVDE